MTRCGLRPITGTISATAAMRIAGILERIYALARIPQEPPLTRLMVAQISMSHWFDHGAAKRDFDYMPQISTEEGLRRTAAWFST